MYLRKPYKLILGLPWLWIIVFNGYFTIQAETKECNFGELCAYGNVSEEVCISRGCCFAEKEDVISTCFQNLKHLPYHATIPTTTTTKYKIEKFGEIIPDDGVKLPYNLEKTMVNLTNLTKRSAIEAINELERYFREKSIEENSNVDWDHEITNVFNTLVKVNPNSIFEVIKFASGTEIQLKQHWGTLENGTVRNISKAIFAEYPTLISVFRKEQGPRSDECRITEKYMDDSPVISINTYDEDWNKLSVPVVYTVKNLNTTTPFLPEDMSADLSCTYLDELVRKWNLSGCAVTSVNNGEMTCSCNHTTKFSMLFVINVIELNITRRHMDYIQSLEYIMESLSLACLIATFGVLWLVQRRRSKASSVSSMRSVERTTVHANFVAALAFLHLVRLLSELAQQEDMACRVVAVLSHYFMLASGMWMLIEGMLLYLNVIIRSMKNTALGVHKYWTGWGIPAVIVFISAMIGFLQNIYLDRPVVETCQEEEGVEKTPLFTKTYQSYCWLNKKDGMIWAATGPLIFIFSVNIFILAHTVIFVWRLNRKTDTMMPSDSNRDSKHFWKTAKSILVLFPILGAPWLIGFLINTEQTLLNVIFQYIHVILNGLQGFFIFLLYCVVNRESRGIVTRVASNRWEQHKVSISASNTLARSTSGGSRRTRGHRKSISSQMGASELNATGTPVYTRRPSNVRSIGSAASQYSIYTSSMNRKQSSGSGSTSLSGCAHRINRIIPTGPNDMIRHTSGYYMKAGCSASLPRLGKIERYSRLVRSGSVSSINMLGRQSIYTSGRYAVYRQDPELATNYICKACKDMPCVHAASDVAGLQEVHDSGTDAVLVGYKRTSSLDSLHAMDAYQPNRWPRRMTAEEFKRFSAIPEEKRRSGINSFIQGDSTEHLSNRISMLSSFKGEDIEMKEMHKTKVEVVVEEVPPGDQVNNEYYIKKDALHSPNSNSETLVTVPVINATSTDIQNKNINKIDDELGKQQLNIESKVEENQQPSSILCEDEIKTEAVYNETELGPLERLRREELKLTD
ncbi:uncharacterized protein LOC120336161 [Styela clava]